jgi:hypothetical protein
MENHRSPSGSHPEGHQDCLDDEVAVLAEAHGQPTTSLECRSNTAQSYNQYSALRWCVMSVIHMVSGGVAVTLRSKWLRLPGIGVPEDFGRKRPRWRRPRKPDRCIRRTTR